jgi:hypothetical protein
MEMLLSTLPVTAKCRWTDRDPVLSRVRQHVLKRLAGLQ